LSSEDVYEGEEEEEKVRDKAEGDEVGVDQYVMSMLTTFGELTVDRLHAYLKRFASSAMVYTWHEMQLQDHLTQMEHRAVITQKDGVYRKK
jgi:hypothetical protein